MPMLEFSTTGNAGVAMRCLNILHQSLSATPLALETKIKCVVDLCDSMSTKQVDGSNENKKLSAFPKVTVPQSTHVCLAFNTFPVFLFLHIKGLQNKHLFKQKNTFTFWLPLSGAQGLINKWVTGVS